jgi:hypothetical protein
MPLSLALLQLQFDSLPNLLLFLDLPSFTTFLPHLVIFLHFLLNLPIFTMVKLGFYPASVNLQAVKNITLNLQR